MIGVRYLVVLAGMVIASWVLSYGVGWLLLGMAGPAALLVYLPLLPLGFVAGRQVYRRFEPWVLGERRESRQPVKQWTEDQL